MKNAGRMMGVVSAALLLTGTSLCGRSHATEQRYPVYQLQTAPDLKAEVYEEAVWQNIPWATGFYKLSTARKVTLQTHFKIGFTAEALYFLVKCEEPDMAKIKADGKDGNPALWREDSIEVFVHPKDTEHVLQVLTNAGGDHSNMLNELDVYNATDLSKSATGAFQGNDEYHVSVMIPFSSLRDTAPADGEAWRFNVLRNRMINGADGEDRLSTFSRLFRSSLEPDNYQEMVFHHRPATEEDGKLLYDNPAQDEDAGVHQIVNLSFNEGGGDIANAQGAVLNHGDMRAAGWSGKGKIGYCAELRKEGDFIEIAHSPSLESTATELALDLWAYFDLEKLKGKSCTLVTKAPGGGFGYGYMLEYIDTADKAQALGFYVAESWRTRGHHVLNNAIATTGWHHIVATFSATTKEIVLFIDGVKAFSQASLTQSIAPSTSPLIIGAIARDHKDSTKVMTFLGRIDEVKIWSKALTARDIQIYYGHMFVKSGLVSPEHLATVTDTKPLLAWTPAKDGTAAILELSSTPDFVEASTFRKKMEESEYRPETPLAPGVWYWRIFSTDADGKQTSGTKTQAFVVSTGTKEVAFSKADTTPPVITGVRPFAFNTVSSDRPVIKARWVDNESLDLATARLFLDEKDVSSKARISAQGLQFTPGEPLSNGNHTIRVEIRDTAGNTANAVKQPFSVGGEFELHLELRDRRIYINDETFLPLIYYHNFADSTDEEMMDLGWNTRHLVVSSPDGYQKRYKTKNLAQGLSRFCDETSRFGQMLFLDFMNYYDHDYGSILPIEETLKILKGHPRIMGLTLDEPNGRPEGVGWAENLYRNARKVGETRPVFHLLNGPSSASVFGADGIGDGVVNDIYPYPSQPGLMVAKATDVGRKAVHYRKPVWLYVQACDLSKPGLITALSETEREQLKSAVPAGGIGCMMYLAFVHEATGLGWWIHHPGYVGHGGYFKKMKEEIMNCVSQARHLAPMLLAPDAPVKVAVEPNDLGLHLRAKEYDGRTYIIAVNPHEELPVSCRFALPEGKSFKKVDVLFEDRSFRPGKKTGSFGDLFAPRAVHVYRIEK